ncbi:LysR family transcriptional regulator [Comamonas sp. CAH-2]|uniref:LysR family transcriptional regulator n=1 Tax=Comamonas sp. CAH-2 TaxID=2605745 RepID=UPI0012AD4D40|nr:LysR family transcriptional regulator [Comamonas sp. CAH-2]MRT19801.1 LysR family transcriptional regulator [Comamonas sp. CAH-2]
MDEHRLKCFVAVYEQGSVSAAAERLHMTQPPLSILLRKLEDELGVNLFDRSGHRLVPTATGELFYLRAKALQANLQAMRRELRETAQGSRGTVHIGCATAASLFIMPRVMEQLLASAMKITVHVHEGETGYLLQRLRERSLDLVICRSQFAAPELQNQEVMNEPLRVALPPQHPLCGQAQIALGALRAERFLLHSSLLGTGISDMLLRACQEAGFTPEVAYWGVETLPMLLMVQKGLGVAFAPDSFAQLGVQGLPVLVPLADAKLRTHLNMIWPRGHALPPAAERLKELILAQCLPPPTCAQAKGPAQVPEA